jgi:hypothetical protein
MAYIVTPNGPSETAIDDKGYVEFHTHFRLTHRNDEPDVGDDWRISITNVAIKPFPYHFIDGIEIISDAAKRVIESLEPGIHQFIPVAVECPERLAGQSSEGLEFQFTNAPYYAVNVRQSFDAIDKDRSSVRRNEMVKTKNIYNVRLDEGPFYVRADTVAGKHLWTGGGGVLESKYFISDELKAAFDAKGVRGLGLVKCLDA